MDVGNKNRAWIKRPQLGMLQDQNDESSMHHNQNQATCDSHPYLQRNTSEMCYRKETNNCQMKNQVNLDRFAKVHNDEN